MLTMTPGAWKQTAPQLSLRVRPRPQGTRRSLARSPEAEDAAGRAWLPEPQNPTNVFLRATKRVGVWGAASITDTSQTGLASGPQAPHLLAMIPGKLLSIFKPQFTHL